MPVEPNLYFQDYPDASFIRASHGFCFPVARRLRFGAERSDPDLADQQDAGAVRRLRGAEVQGSALNPTVSQSQRSYRIVVPSKVSADNVLEAYKAGKGGKVFIYERHLLASNLLPSSFERAAQECI